jgi:translation initiation factor IF-2
LKKVRVFELAKEFGMRGPDLAKLLREIGFENIKTHMTVLDDADLMMVEARLSAQGLRRQPVAEEATPSASPKKKLLSAAAGDDQETDSESLQAKKELKELPKKPLPKTPLKRMPSRRDAPAAATRSTAEPHEATLEPIAKTSVPPAAAAAAEAPPAGKPEVVTPAAVTPAAGSPAAVSPGVGVPPTAAPQPAARQAAPVAPVSGRKTLESEAAATTSAPALPPVKPALPPVKKVETTQQPATATPLPPVEAPAKADVSTPQETVVASSGTPGAVASATGTPASVAPAADTPAADIPAAETPAADTPAADTPLTVPPATGATIPPAAAAPEVDGVRRLLVPQKKATVVGRIELPQETIRDATRRSAPAAPRDLRRAALQKMQQRTGVRPSPQTGMRRPPAGPGQTGQRPTGRDMGRGGFGGQRKQRSAPSLDPNKVVEVQEPVSMKALSEALGIKVNELIGTLTFRLKIAGKNINSLLSNEEVELVGLELERNVKIVEHKEAMDQLIEQLVEDSADEESVVRAPVVTFMGHVDHGKTSLMDALRNSDVTKHEAGGITQHIGAYKVTNEDGSAFVVLDTPGHAAFTAMRARGADLTDIVVLVVAADDGVMPQTEEAINHAKAAKVPIIVAITKCDLPNAKPMQVKQQLIIKGLQSEDFGGEVGVVEVSATKRTGLDDLIGRIMLEAELLELRARPDAPGKGVVVESRQSPEQGCVVTLLVTDGTMRLKDQMVCGESFARVRAMIDDHGRNLQEAGPSTPITVFGLDRLPSPGDKLFVVEDAKKAREVVEERQRRVRELSRAERSAVTLETLSAKLAERNLKEIKLILKADAMGSLEPIKKCLDDLQTAEVRVNLVHSGLGGINETDVSLAEASGAVIVGFNTVADSSARQQAERAGVEVRYYDVIYHLLDQVRAAMEGMLAPQEVQNVIGHAEIRAIFKSSKFGTIAGCRILDGIAKRSASVRLSREGMVVWSGKLASMRRGEEDVRDIKAGFECGMTLDGYQDLKIGDQLEFVQTELIKRTLGGA